MNPWVVDTNVAIVANGRDTHASLTCQLKCIEYLELIVSSGVVCIDQLDLILAEYHKKLNFGGQPSVGDQFYRHVFENQWITNKIERVKITPTDDNGNFEEVPDSAGLKGFDPDDRKFVAVALSSKGKPKIANAVDSGYSKFNSLLRKLDLCVEELCPDHVGT